LIKNFGTDVDEVVKKEVEKNVDEQISEDIFENLPENIQEAIKLKMSLEDDLRLDEIDLETVQSGDIEEIKKMLEESNIIGKKDETGKIQYEKRVQNNDLLEDIGNVFNKYMEGPDYDKMFNKDNKSKVENNIKDRELVSSAKKTQKIIISNNYRKIDTKKSEERYEPEIAFSGSMVNSNDKILNDLLLTNIRA